MFRGVIRIFEHTFALLRVFMLISLTCFMPRFFITSHKESYKESGPIVLPDVEGGTFSLGLENLQKDDLIFIAGSKNPNIGLVSQSLTTDQAGNSNLDVLKREGLSVTRFFYPKIDRLTHVYEEVQLNDPLVRQCAVGKQGFTLEMLQGVDLIVVDLPAAGLGYVREVPLLFGAIHAAALHDLPIVVLDRPNNMGPKVEGSLCYVAQLPIKIPLRYGMTMGELAHYYNVQMLGGHAKLHVIPMQGYHRAGSKAVSMDSTELYGYGLCGILAEVAPFDVGLDTPYCYSCLTLPQSVALPEKRWYQLQIMLRHMGVKSTLCRHYSSRKQEMCRGLRIYVNDVDQLDCFKVLLLMLEFFKRAGVILSFSDSFDIAVGTPLVRQYLQGKVAKKVLCQTINQDLEEFYHKAFGAFLYHPLPHISLV